MKQLTTHKFWLRRLMVAFSCLATVTAIQAANVTVDGINYTTNNKGEATIAKYTIVKATATTPADTAF